MGTDSQTVTQQPPPDHLPLDFKGWDKPKVAPKSSENPPDHLPLDFKGWDAAPVAKKEVKPPDHLPLNFSGFDEKQVQTPQERILQATVGEGYTPEDAQRRVHEYDYAVKQGLSPERAEKVANALKLKATKKILTPEEKQNVANWYAALPIEKRKEGGVGLVTDPQEFANGYAEARAMGLDDNEAEEYGRSQPLVRAGIRTSNWTGDKFTNAKKGMLWLLGGRDEVSHVKAEDAVSGSLVSALMGMTSQDREFQTQKDADWIDKHIGHPVAVLQEHINHLIDGFTTPDMAALEIATLGGGTVEGMLPEVGTELTAAARATRFAQRTIRTTSKLAHIGFTTQMAEGTVETGSESVKQFAKGNVSEGMGYALDAIVNGLMVAGGMHSVDAHAEVRSALDRKTGEVYSGKRFDQLSDQQQGLIVNRLIEDDPKFKAAADASEKEARKAAIKLRNRYGAALNQTWNPNAAERAIRKLHVDRAELAIRKQENAVLEAARKAVEENKKAEAVKAEKIISDNESARQRNMKAREERENETPRPQATESVPQMEVDGEIVYGPVTRLEQESHIGVEPLSDGYGVYIQEKDGETRQYLNSQGFWGAEESAARVQDDESARTLAKIQALRTTTVEDAEKETNLENVTKQLIDHEIDSRHMA